MEQRRNFTVTSTNHNRPIVTDIFYNKTNTKKPVVIFCHGYKGYKDWGAWNQVAEAFAAKGMFFLKFNFSHNGGTLEKPIDFPDLKAFSENNYSTELADLKDIIQWLVSNDNYSSEIDPANITLIGHSRGGGIVSLMASRDKNTNRLISWAGVSDFEARFPKGEALEEWREKGVNYVINSRTNQKMPHLFQFYEDFQKNAESLHIQKSVAQLKKPHLIIQGSEDQAVSIEEAQHLHQWNPDSELLIIAGMNHTLGSTHPWNSDKMPAFLAQVVATSIRFILKGTLKD